MGKAAAAYRGSDHRFVEDAIRGGLQPTGVHISRMGRTKIIEADFPRQKCKIRVEMRDDGSIDARVVGHGTRSTTINQVDAIALVERWANDIPPTATPRVQVSVSQP